MKKPVILIGQATDEQIAKWKEENPGGIFAIKIGGHIVYCRYPEIADINIAQSEMTADATLGFYQALFREIKLGGSEEIANKYPLLKGFISQVDVILKGEESELVNL